ncbi:MAG: hypothetical protein ACREB5_02250, partial [Sphingomonadaceae bacterium]
MAVMAGQARLADLDANDAPKAIAECLLEDGAVIVRRVVPQVTLAGFNAEIDQYFASHDTVDRRYLNDTLTHFYGPQTRHVAGLAGKSAVFRRDILC